MSQHTSAPKPSKSVMRHLHQSWKRLPLTRDKADTLLLLASYLLVLLPHLALLDWWIAGSCALLIFWRAWLTLSGRRLPPAWLLIPISLLLMGGIFLTYRSFFVREAGVAMVVLLLSCKLLEMHARRDVFVVIFLSFFLLLTGFFYSQSMAGAALALLAVLALLTTLLSFQYTGVVPPLWQRIKLGLKILGMAIPLTVLAFFLFPRIQGPLWSLPGDGHSGRSGLSESMAPGNISNLALSEEIAFRVKFDGPPPDKSQLYWRAIVLNHFDGRVWSRQDFPREARPQDLFSSSDAPVRQQIIQEASGQAWLFGLDIPAAPPSLEGMRSNLNTQFEMYASQPINSRIRYQLSSYPNHRLQAEQAPRHLRTSVELPPTSNPQTRRYAEQLRARSANPQERIDAVLQLFRRENFVYTLEPPLLPEINGVDEFLFSTRAGFCEHFAGAFVVLMRAMEIPARVVTGYQGGSFNNIDGYLEVRQSDAHAWAEVWLAGRGWVRVDPTAAVAPERVTLNLSSTQRERGMAGLVNFAIGANSWFQNLRMRWNAANNTWNLWMLNYNQARQLDFLRSLGLAGLDWPQLAALFFLLGSLAMGLVALPLVLNRPKISALDQVYFKLCQKLAGAAYPKMLHEGPIAYAERLKLSLPEPQFQTIQEFLSLYAAAKYGKNALPEAAVLARLKTLLAQSRWPN